MLVTSLARIRAFLSCALRAAVSAAVLPAAVAFSTAFALASPAFAQSADLVVNQADSPDPGPAGGTFTYVIRIDNNGPNDASAVAFSDTLPAGATFVSATTTQGSCGAPSGGVLGCTLGDLAYTANATVVIKVVLPLAGVYTNTASATSATPDPYTPNNLDVVEDTTAVNASDMQLTATDAPDPVAAGANYSYTLTAKNNGPADAASQTVSFPVPAGACIRSAPTGTGWTCTASGAYPLCGGTISCTRNATLANGATAPAITVPAVANVGGTITGSFTVSSPLPDGNTGNNTPTAQTTVIGGNSDVQITKSASPTTVAVGSNVTYTLTPRHNGGEPPGTLAPNLITVTDVLPAGVTFVSATGTGWTCSESGGTVTCTRPGPYTGGNFTNMDTIAIVATVIATGTIGNAASIAIPETDPVPANNTSSTVNITGSASADASITKAGPGFPVFPGDDFTFVLTPRNNGAVILPVGEVVTVTDNIAAGFNIRGAPTSSTTGFWSCTINGVAAASVAYPVAGPAALVCTRTLTAIVGANTNMPTVVIPVETNTTGTFANQACVAISGALTDSNPANDCSANVSVPSTPSGGGADLQVVSKTATPNPVRAGEDLTYVITVRNNGPQDATNAIVTDALANLVATGSIQSIVASQGSCTPATLPSNGASQTVSCNLGTLLNGATATVTIVARPLVTTTANRTNTATISSSDLADPNRGNNSGSVTSQVTALADVTVTKTDTPDPVQAGTPLTYVVTARNGGPSTASAVTVNDPLPANVAFVSATPSAGTCTTPAVGSTGGTVACSLGNIGNGNQQTVTIVVRPLTGETAVHNTATVSTTTDESNTGNNSATADTVVTNAAADVLVNKVDTVDPVAVGQMTGYVVTVTNSGPSYATGVTLVDTFPAGSPTATFSYQGGLAIAPAGAGTCSEPAIDATSGTIACAFPGLASGSSIVVTYNMRSESIASGTSGTTFNGAVVAANEPDALPANNATVHSTTTRQATDLGLTKSGSPNPVLAGGTLTWTLVVTNYGPQASTGATLSDPAIAGFTPTGTPGLPPGTTCSIVAGAVNCTLGTLAAGSSLTLQVTGTVDAAFAGNSITNTATVTAVNEIDIVPGNNSNGGTVTVNHQADLKVTKVVNDATPAVGDTVTFTITAENLGPNPAVAAVVTDALPAGYALQSATPSVGSWSSGTWTLGNMAVGATATLAITAKVNPEGPYLNTATIGSGTPDPNTGNNSSNAGTTPSPRSSLAVAKTDDSETYTPGGTGTYVITVTNGGPSAASNVTVTDALPAGVTLAGTVTCATNGTANCGTVTGVAGGTSLGTTTASIAAGAGNSIVLTAPVAYDMAMTTDPLVNTATATDPSSPGASGSDSSTRGAEVALEVTKSDGSETYTPGGTATYAVNVRNLGPSNATDVTVEDLFPAGLTLTAPPTCTPVGNASCGTVTGAIGDTGFGTTGATLGAAVGDALQFTVHVAFAPGMTADPLVNEVTAVDEPTEASASGSDSNALASQVSLAVVKTDGSTTYTPGGTATYTITVSNTGLSTANSVTLTDALPAGVTLTGAATCTAAGASSCGTVTGSAGGTSLGSTGAVIVPGAGNALTFSAPVAFAADLEADPLENTANVVDVPTGATGSGVDSNERLADVTLAVTKTDNATTYAPGGTATYVITVTNTGLSDALDVTVTDSLPAGVTLTGVPGCVANGDASCGSVTGAAGDAAFGSSGATVGAGAGNALVFSVPVAFASSMTADPLVNTVSVVDEDSGATASGSDSNTLSRSVVLGVTKSDGQPSYAPGSAATYVIVVSNTGISDATSVTVSDTLPPGVTLTAPVTCTPAGTATCGNVVAGSAGAGAFGTTDATIAAGAGNTLTFSAPVAFSASLATDPLVNTVNVADPPSGATASAVDSNVLATVAPTLAKSIAPATIAAGGSATLTITLGNPNTVPATLSSAFVDSMPAGVTITSANLGSCSDVATSSTSVTKAAGSSVAPGGCTIVVSITSSTVGSVTNTTGSLETDLGSAPPASAPLTVVLGGGVTLRKGIAPATVAVGGSATLTITLGNTSAIGLALDAAFTDTMPAGMTVTSAASSGSCSSVTVSPTALSMPAGTVIPPGGCSIVVTVTSSTVGTLVNVTSALEAGGSAAPAASAPLTVNALPPVPPPEAIPATDRWALALLLAALALLGAGGLRRGLRSQGPRSR